MIPDVWLGNLSGFFCHLPRWDRVWKYDLGRNQGLRFGQKAEGSNVIWPLFYRGATPCCEVSPVSGPASPIYLCVYNLSSFVSRTDTEHKGWSLPGVEITVLFLSIPFPYFSVILCIYWSLEKEFSLAFLSQPLGMVYSY